MRVLPQYLVLLEQNRPNALLLLGLCHLSTATSGKMVPGRPGYETGRCDCATVRGEMLTTDLGLIFEIRQIFVVWYERWDDCIGAHSCKSETPFQQSHDRCIALRALPRVFPIVLGGPMVGVPAYSYMKCTGSAIFYYDHQHKPTAGCFCHFQRLTYPSSVNQYSIC